MKSSLNDVDYILFIHTNLSLSIQTTQVLAFHLLSYSIQAVMTTSSTKTICSVCEKNKITYPCSGCAQNFCLDHLPEHRKKLGQQLEEIHTDHDQFRQEINEQMIDPMEHPLITQINQWEVNSIDRILQAAQECREKFLQYFNAFSLKLQRELNDLAQHTRQIRQENEFHESDLNELRQRLRKLQELHRTADISIRQQSTAVINLISLEKGITVE